MRVLIFFLSGLLSFAVASGIQAMTEYPEPFTITQPDGTNTPPLRLKTMGVDVFLETVDGHTVSMNGNKTIVYVRRDKRTGELVPTDRVVGKDTPALPLHERPSESALKRHREKMGCRGCVPEQMKEKQLDLENERKSKRKQRRLAITHGTLNNLVVPIRFADHATRVLPSKEDLSVLFNADGGDSSLAPTGSVKDALKISSHGKLDLNSTVVDWIQLDSAEEYYADGQRGFTTKLHAAIGEALDKLQNRGDVRFQDFNQDGDALIDSITILHSGYSAEFGKTSADGAYFMDRIWSHKWSLNGLPNGRWTAKGSPTVQVRKYHISSALWGSKGNEIGRIGVIAHETGHFLGINYDLYDTDGNDPGKGVGNWGLMGNSWGFLSNQLYPPIMSPWVKIQLGWVEPQVITAAGSYSIKQSYNNNVVLKITHGFPDGEYLLIENRQPVGFETHLPQGGLAIWHIDEKAGWHTQGYPGQDGWPENGKHYAVALVQADGKYDLEWGNNMGDSLDLFHKFGTRSLVPSSYSKSDINSDSYQGGNIVETGVFITEISEAAETMTFKLGFSAPNTPAPTPLTQCPPGYNMFDLTIKTDSYPKETSWELEKDGLLHRNKPRLYFQEKNQVYSENFCILPGNYKFTMHDSSRDGICCGYGDGSYVVLVDGTEVARGGSFKSLESTEFSVKKTAPPPSTGPTVSPTASPTASPTSRPTMSPTLKPTMSPTNPPQVTSTEIPTTTPGSSGEQILATTMDGTKYRAGIMFDVVAVNDIEITSLSTVAKATPGLFAEVYARDGTHVGYEKDTTAWKKVMTAKAVDGDGLSSYTPLGALDTKVTVMAGSTVSFYVTFTTGRTMQISVGTGLGNVFASNRDVMILEGTAKGYKFSRSLGVHGFNGEIGYVRLGASGQTTEVPTYIPTGNPTGSPTSSPTAPPTTAPTVSPTSAPTRSPTANPTKSPTASPTSSPTSRPTLSPTELPTPSPTGAPTIAPTPGSANFGAFTGEHVLVTQSDGTRRKAGIMFDVVAINDIQIVSFDAAARKIDGLIAEIYAKNGTHVGYEKKREAWKKVLRAKTVDGKGSSALTPLGNLDKKIILEAGSTMAFYVTFTTGSSMTMTTAPQVGDIVASNLDVMILGGRGKMYSFSRNFGAYIFNGAVKYMKRDGSESNSRLLSVETN